jgi:formate--tetrahydrofolate ligase
MSPHPTDLDIARAATLTPISHIAESLGLRPDDLEQYGPYKAKIKLEATQNREMKGRLILVSAITPTPGGEGKTTVSVGLGQALHKLGKKTIIALREPSLGPCLGMKGGATGGGYSQVLPMEDINLHFTGDLHAVTAAHNLLAALIDNALYHGLEPQLDARRVVWRRVLDMNDRALRQTVVGLGAPTDGVPRQSGFDITAASEVMAALCLAEDLKDLQNRMARFIVGYDRDKNPITAGDLGADGAMAVLLKDAIKPNLVQSLEGTPALIHGGPFANIAHGTNSIIADKMALRLADYVVTEAGFGFDLGGEKFFDIMCRSSGLSPSCIALVATVRALKMHGGVPKDALNSPNVEALKKGLPNLEGHLESAQKFGVPIVVCVNRFSQDTDEEVELVVSHCRSLGHKAEAMTSWADGGSGGLKAAEQVCELVDSFNGRAKFLYEDDDSIEVKITNVAREIYGADGVEFSARAKRDLKEIQKQGLSHLPVCIAKTQKSLSDNPKLLGRPEGFVLGVREIHISAGAGFVVPITGDILRMPGLSKKPAACAIGIDAQGQIQGLS